MQLRKTSQDYKLSILASTPTISILKFWGFSVVKSVDTNS